MFIAIWFFRQVFLWTRRFLSQVFCCHTQSCELQKFTKHTIKRLLFFHKLTNKSISQHQGAILRSTAKKPAGKKGKRQNYCQGLLQKQHISAGANPTWLILWHTENLSPDPTFGGCGRQEHARKMHCPHPQEISMHAVDTSTGTSASWQGNGEFKLTNPTKLGRNPLLLEATCTRTPQLSLSNWQARQMESILASPHRNETMGKILMLIVSTSAFSSLEIWKAFKARSAKCLLSTHSSPVK